MRRVLRVRLQVGIDYMLLWLLCGRKCSIQYIRWLLWMLLLCGRHMCSCGVGPGRSRGVLKVVSYTAALRQLPILVLGGGVADDRITRSGLAAGLRTGRLMLHAGGLHLLCPRRRLCSYLRTQLSTTARRQRTGLSRMLCCE